MLKGCKLFTTTWEFISKKGTRFGNCDSYCVTFVKLYDEGASQSGNWRGNFLLIWNSWGYENQVGIKSEIFYFNSNAHTHQEVVTKKGKSRRTGKRTHKIPRWAILRPSVTPVAWRLMKISKIISIIGHRFIDFSSSGHQSTSNLKLRRNILAVMRQSWMEWNITSIIIPLPFIHFLASSSFGSW